MFDVVEVTERPYTFEEALNYVEGTMPVAGKDSARYGSCAVAELCGYVDKKSLLTIYVVMHWACPKVMTSIIGLQRQRNTK